LNMQMTVKFSANAFDMESDRHNVVRNITCE
jgi:hypothetical protein